MNDIYLRTWVFDITAEAELYPRICGVSDAVSECLDQGICIGDMTIVDCKCQCSSDRIQLRWVGLAKHITLLRCVSLHQCHISSGMLDGKQHQMVSRGTSGQSSLTNFVGDQQMYADNESTRSHDRP
jgi:hypothetical protein